MRIDFVSLFPDMLWPALRASMMRKATESGAAEFSVTNPRDFCYDRHAKVDDTPYGGEPGMLIKAEPIAQAIEHLELSSAKTSIVLTDPAGTVFQQSDAKELAQLDHVIFLCGHYEGIDHRIEEEYVTHSFSIGDYVLTNGELPALIMADAMVRLIPGVLGCQGSLEADSFASGLLSAPNFTRPEEWRGRKVPDVLLSGNHKAVEKWRRTKGLERTILRRPDLLAKTELTREDIKLLDSLSQIGE